MIGGIALPGGAVYINHQSIRDRKWQSAVSLAGPFANIVVACVLAIPFILGWDRIHLDASRSSDWAVYIYPAIAYMINLNIFVILINLLPIPGLDGFGIIEPWLPRGLKPKISWLYQYGVWILIGLLWFVTPFNRFLWETTFNFGNQLQVPRELIVVGSQEFRKYSVFLVIGLIAILWIFRDKNKDTYRRGTQLVTQGKYSHALEKFDRLVQAQPDNVDALFMQGYTLYCLRRYDDALISYARALEFQPESAQIYYYQGIIYKDIGDASAAMSSFSRATQHNPDDGRSWYEQAGLLFAEQADTEALAAIERVLELEPNQADAWELKADILKYLEKSTEAIAAYDRAFNLNPKSSAWIKLVKLYEKISTPENNQAENLFALYTRKLRLQPQNPEIWYRQGISYSKFQRQAEAEKSYNQGLECLIHQTKRHPRSSQAWYEQGKYLEKLGKHEQAIAAYEHAAINWENVLQRKDIKASEWYEYGLLREKIHDYTVAITAYTQAIAIDPQYHQAAYRLAIIHLDEQAYLPALAACDKVLEYCDDNSSIWWLRSDILIKLEKYAQAIAACDRAIQIYPEFYGFWLSRGTALYHLHEYTDAHAAYDTATQSKPTSAIAWNYKALALIQLGKKHSQQYLLDSMNAIKQAIQINSNYGDGWYNQACIYALQNHSESAISALTQAIQIDQIRYVHLAKQDPDFDQIRSNPEFISMIES